MFSAQQWIERFIQPALPASIPAQLRLSLIAHGATDAVWGSFVVPAEFPFLHCPMVARLSKLKHLLDNKD